MESSPRPVAVLGASGRTGRLVVAAIAADPALSLAAAVVGGASSHLGLDAGALCGVGVLGVPLTAVGPGCFGEAEVVIDFSLPHALASALPHLGARGLVSGTTGSSTPLLEQLEAHSLRAPVLCAANFSLGIELLKDLLARAVVALPSADIEVIEAHHRHKRDAPSGTALALAEVAARARGLDPQRALVHGRRGAVGPRPTDQIGLHALRGGDVTGAHTVWLLADGERIALSHEASDRSTFARGAVRAARWLLDRAPGRYLLADVLAPEPRTTSRGGSGGV
ncbi:MAG TPA: 4-hydroxy-tetrahydrodipicolinate reductase [Deltaproteobacteria bacterium]|nr:4-hydroxy-tetrahydrodipicolinate reductase [Deltaproteobacteria bacterium]